MPLLSGVNHIALLTEDTDRFHDFYRDVFDAQVLLDLDVGPLRHSFVEVGPGTVLHPFELRGNGPLPPPPPMFARGRLDHLGLSVADEAAFDVVRSRLVARGASDGVVTDFVAMVSTAFTDPDGLVSEVCLLRPGRVMAEARDPEELALGR